MNELILFLIFFVIALFYSSIGFGGGSSYLAILSLVFVGFYEVRTLALVLNVMVVSIGTFVFWRQKVFDWSSFWPFILLSVPLAFIGAQLRLSEKAFFVLLGSALILAAVFLVLQMLKRGRLSRRLNTSSSMIIGGGIGLLSGLVGIGGGIFLSPTLNLMQWKNAKIVASLASVFILVNSIAGISGMLIRRTFVLEMQSALPILGSVFLGGLIGSQLSIRMDLNIIKGLTALLVLYVGVRIVLQHFFGILI